MTPVDDSALAISTCNKLAQRSWDCSHQSHTLRTLQRHPVICIALGHQYDVLHRRSGKSRQTAILSMLWRLSGAAAGPRSTAALRPSIDYPLDVLASSRAADGAVRPGGGQAEGAGARLPGGVPVAPGAAAARHRGGAAREVRRDARRRAHPGRCAFADETACCLRLSCCQLAALVRAQDVYTQPSHDIKHNSQAASRGTTPGYL